MFVRLMTLITILSFTAGMFMFWNWIGLHFADAPAQKEFGLSPVFVGMVLFFIVFYGGLAIWAVISNTVKWVIKG
jgi:hypothetical protein